MDNLDRLRREVRTLRRIVFATSLLLSAGVVGLAVKFEPKPDIISARKFVVTDEHGQPRGEFMASPGGAYLCLLDATGRDGVLLHTSGGRNAPIMLGLSPLDGTPSFVMREGGGSIELYADSNGSPHLTFLDKGPGQLDMGAGFLSISSRGSVQLDAREGRQRIALTKDGKTVSVGQR